MTSGRFSSALPQPCRLACATISHFGSRNSAAKESASSGLRQTDCILFSLALARVTFARMSDAFAVQMNGFG